MSIQIHVPYSVNFDFEQLKEEKLNEIDDEYLKYRVDGILKKMRSEIKTMAALKRAFYLYFNVSVSFKTVLKNGKWTATCSILSYEFSTVSSGKNIGTHNLVRLVCCCFMKYPQLLNKLM